MNQPISASSAIACRWRISALVETSDDAVDHLLEPVRARVVGVRPGPAIHEEGRRPGDATRFSLLAARLDPAGAAATGPLVTGASAGGWRDAHASPAAPARTTTPSSA